MLSTLRAFSPSTIDHTSRCNRFRLVGLQGLAVYALARLIVAAFAIQGRMHRHHDGLLAVAVEHRPGDWREAWLEEGEAMVTLHVQLWNHRIVIDRQR